MITCIIVDDEQHAVDLLTGYVNKIPGISLALATTKPIEAFQFLQKNKVDLVYLDIHMPDLNGMQFLKLLGGTSKVILTTAYAEYALEGYELDVTDYLLKPVLFDRFLKATQKAIDALEPKAPVVEHVIQPPMEEDYIFIKGEARSKLIKIKLDEIIYVEALGNYVTFYLDNAKIVTLMTMKELEEKLPGRAFVRTHKSYLVAIAKITSIEGNTVYVGKTEIPLGEKYKEAFFRSINGKIINP